MDKIVGLGKAGCAIADKFAKYPQYSVYKLDVGLDASPTTFPMKEHQKIEDYEEKCPNLSKFFKDLDGEVLFIVAGGGRISGSSLRVLEALKNCKLNVMYIRPDQTFLGKEAKALDDMVFGVFQEYARSGVFERLYLADNTRLEEILPEASLKEHYNNINEAICSTIHMINFFKFTKPVTETYSDLPLGARISSLGIVNPEKNEDLMFFDLDKPTDVVYYYAYNSETLETNKKLFTEIKNNIKSKMVDDVRFMYGVYESMYDQEYAYCVKHTSFVQQAGGSGDLPTSP